ncbi:hypothetical protein OA58_22785 [Microcystis aeruginosa NIES-88]|nr:hypothetical protein OA58_22785 [Microcystis aeruginosa NIES-88]
MIAITEVSKKEMNNLKTLSIARINLRFVGWIRINLTGYREKYKISRGITKNEFIPCFSEKTCQSQWNIYS